MRTKEFIIFIVIFTVLYIAFFIVFDRVMDNKTKEKRQEYAKNLIKLEQYIKFANFYGIQTIANIETIMQIYTEFCDGKDCIISEKAKSYNLSNLEFVVIILYLEYLNLMNKKIISLEMDSMKKTTFVEQNMIQKYTTYFKDKRDFDFIITNMGKNTLNDLTNINNNLLMPGVRLIDSKLYYVEDYL